MSYARLVVGDQFGALLDELEVNLQFVNWRLNKIGKCKFDIAANDPKSTAGNLKFGNRVLIEFDNGLPAWVGIIDPFRDWDKDLITVNCYDPGEIFQYRITDKGRYFTAEAAGSIFKAVIDDANIVALTGVLIGEIYSGGDAHSPDYHLKPLIEIFQDSILTRLSNYDFGFTGSLVDGVIQMTANFYEMKGSIKPSTVLIQGNNLSEVKLSEQGPIINKWVVAGEGTGWGAERLTSTAVDQDSIDTYGLREASRVYGDVKEQGTLDQNAANLLEQTKDPYNIFTLSAVDAEPAKFSAYDIGDTVRLIAPDYGFDGTDTMVRILSREFKPGDGVCDLVVQESL